MPVEPRREMITWQELDKLIDQLLPQFRREFTAMVVITRGGSSWRDACRSDGHYTRAHRCRGFSAQYKTEKSPLMAWPEFIQFPAKKNYAVVRR